MNPEIQGQIDYLEQTMHTNVMSSRTCVFSILFLLFSSAASAQQIEQSASYVSQLDQSLTVRRVGVLPVTDNIEGIYARQIENQIVDLIKGSHRWDYVETKVAGQLLTPQDLESAPEQVKALATGSGADGLFAVRASRGPNGVTITMDFFLVADGRLLLQETVKDYPQFDIKDLLSQTQSLYNKLVQKMPYSGLVLSRQNNRVTINLGKRDGMVPNTIVSAVLIIKASRHPKFNFLISTEREVLGKIKIEKVDETISFGVVVSEKARGSVERFSKIAGIDSVKYDDPQGFVSSSKDGLNLNEDGNKITFGTGAQEWIPTAPPTFGKVDLLLGFGSYVYNMNVDGVGSMKASNNFFPSIRLDGELWITPEWNVITMIRQGVLSVANPRSGSSPADLSVSLSRYSLYVAHNFLIKGDFFGPKIQVFAGWTKYSTFVDASTPLGLTSTSYSGLALGLKGELPVTDDELWTVGAGLELFLSTDLTETPESSGKTNRNTVNSFSAYAIRRLTQRLHAIGSMDFEQYSTTFAGSGTRAEPALNSSQRSTIFMGGIEYLF